MRRVLGQSAAVREATTERYYRRSAPQRLFIRPHGHLGTAGWFRRYFTPIRRLFPYLRRVATIAMQPRELQAPQENPVTAATRVGVITGVLFVAAGPWLRRRRI